MDRIDLLENRVRDMIALVQNLRDENQHLRAELEAQQSRLSGLTAEQQVIDEERDLLRDRIERMLRDMESLDGAAGSAPGETAALPDLATPAAERGRPEDVSLDAPTQPTMEFTPLGTRRTTSPSAIELGPDEDTRSAGQAGQAGAGQSEAEQTIRDSSPAADDRAGAGPTATRGKRAEARAAAREESTPAPAIVGTGPAGTSSASTNPDSPGRPGSDPAHPVLPGFM
ncbi:MAG: cell division protein ZapB [Nitrospirota bacterium]|nr:cell division protein ZapB [Nitrospirota bacterium]